MNHINQAQPDVISTITSRIKSKSVVIGLVVIVLSAGLYFLSRYNYPLFHSIVDTVTVFIAAGVFVVVWNRRHMLDNHYYLYVGIAFLFFALVDFLHLLGNKGMDVFPQYGNLGPALYITSRYILSISLVIAPLFVTRKFNAKIVLVIYAFVTTMIMLSIFYWRNFPVTYIEGSGLTPFKVISDYIICFILAGAIGLLYIERRAFDLKVFRIIVYALIFSIATGLAFTLYSDPFGIANAVGHFFQITSFYLIYVAFVQTVLINPQDILYRNLKQSKEEVLKLNSELERVNINLSRDIAKREKVEEALKIRTNELVRSNTELEQFAYVASHDLQEPLRMVASYVQLLARRYQGKLDRDADDFIHYATDGAGRMQLLINDLLEFSRVSTRGGELKPTIVEVVLKKVLENLQVIISETGAVVTYDPLPVVNADQIQIGQVFQNLISNAIKFRGDKSPLIHVGVQTKENEHIFSISDNGIGINPADFDKLFVIFHRLHSRDEYEGTGIGLAVCKRIIERHHGRIWVDSTPGAGSTFHFTLPVS